MLHFYKIINSYYNFQHNFDNASLSEVSYELIFRQHMLFNNKMEYIEFKNHLGSVNFIVLLIGQGLTNCLTND